MAWALRLRRSSRRAFSWRSCAILLSSDTSYASGGRFEVGMGIGAMGGTSSVAIGARVMEILGGNLCARAFGMVKVGRF